ncbi:MAG: D-2-hydroxyacid dehydrogenase [Ectothiorhodospiraceae bacterium]|nr:D-2-hydroxyacid dehydrogenase [Ectothiorhodospiraceae bacterium]
MPVSVGLFDVSAKRLRERIDALGLDIVLRPFDAEGRFEIDGRKVSPAEVELDYLWLAPDLAGGTVGNLPFEVALACKRIDVLQTFNAGLDNPAYRRLAEKGVRICNSSAQSVAIAEYVMASVLAVFHPLEERRAAQARREWKKTPFREIAGTRWLVVGFGPIGREVATRARAFGATIDVVRRSPRAPDFVDEVGTMADIGRFAARADVVVFACALNAQTRKFADESFFATVKPGAVLVNIARGALVDDAALVGALDAGRLSCAVLDVFDPEPLPVDSPLWAHPGVRVTAHTSFGGSGTRGRWDELFFDNLPRYVRGEPLANEVDPADIV